jgi:hypothetical protein
MYIASGCCAEGAADAFSELESHFMRLRGRRFYATSRYKSNDYRACVAIEPGDDPAKLGDQSRPTIEYHPGGNEVILYLPVGH